MKILIPVALAIVGCGYWALAEDKLEEANQADRHAKQQLTKAVRLQECLLCQYVNCVNHEIANLNLCVVTGNIDEKCSQAANVQCKESTLCEKGNKDE